MSADEIERRLTAVERELTLLRGNRDFGAKPHPVQGPKSNAKRR
jgi:hypothetical protein